MIKSIHRKTFEIFSNQPDMVFNTRDITQILRFKCGTDVEKNIVSTILTRLYRQKIIYRTSTQLADGHRYSLRNKQAIDRIYENHLLPYDLQNKKQLIEEVRRNNHTPLRTTDILDMEILRIPDFLRNYTHETSYSNLMIQFLAQLIGFVMCDGNICGELRRVRFFFRRESDAILFINRFKQVFSQESLNHRKNTVGNSYVVEVKKGSKLARFLHLLGAPKGNKAIQAFSVPDWIYHGPDVIKKAFLSTVIGNEGSAPSNRKWRIQFVMSKSEEHVPNLVHLLNQIRGMLNHFDITTSHIQLRKQPRRQFYGRFYIKGRKNLHKFYKQFDFSYASEKQEVLEELMRTAPLRSEMCCDLVNTR